MEESKKTTTISLTGMQTSADDVRKRFADVRIMMTDLLSLCENPTLISTEALIKNLHWLTYLENDAEISD
jgi:hypothetical protein